MASENVKINNLLGSSALPRSVQAALAMLLTSASTSASLWAIPSAVAAADSVSSSACNKMHYQYNVKMNCSGCSNAVSKAVSRLEDIDKVETDLKTQTVDVYTDKVDYQTVLEKIKKTGKEVLGGKIVA